LLTDFVVKVMIFVDLDVKTDLEAVVPQIAHLAVVEVASPSVPLGTMRLGQILVNVRVLHPRT
jgi:hypothetical protein